MKILNRASRSIIVWKIQSCEKQFFFLKRPVDLFDVGKLCQMRVNQYHVWVLLEEFMTGLQKYLIPDLLNSWNEIKFSVNKISDKFSASFDQVG